MQKREYVLALYEIYKKLLTELEQKYFEYYYFEDYSMQEIADALNVSKANVGKFINKIEVKLSKFEDSLNIYDTNNKLKELIKDLDDKELKSKIEELL